MSTVRICRICLRTEAKGYKFDRFQLKYFYEEVTAQKVPDNDELPQWFCYECATILHKFHKFKEKCYIGQKCLKEMLRIGPITYEAIYKLDRTTKQLKTTIERFILSDRVKTFTIINKEAKNETEIIDKDFEDKYNVKIENNSQKRCYEIPQIITKVLNTNEFDLKNTNNYNKSEDNQDINNKDFDENHQVDENNRISGQYHYLNNVNQRIDGMEQKSQYHPNKNCIENIDELCNQHGSLSLTDNQHFYTKDKLGNINSPISILVQDDKVIIPKHRKLKKTKTKNLEISVTLSEFGKYLSEDNWEKVVLSEDEALKEFRKKAEDPKYLDALFKCTDCFKGFSKKDMLNRHIQSRHSEDLGVHECRVCRMRFKWHCLLRKHIQQHYIKYECLLCHISFNLDSSALLHEEYHSGAARSCVHCGEQFRHVTTYYTHMRTHRSEHVCVTCGASFVSRAGLTLHAKRKHGRDELASSSDDESPCELHCNRCDIRFRSHRAYTEHLFHSDMHSEVIKEEQDETTPPKKIMSKRLREKITKELGKRKSDLEMSPPIKVKRRKKKTKKWHTKPSTCYQCGEHFSTQAACLKHHVTAHPRTSFHAPNQRHICELCGASLAPGSVALHQNMHTREVVYTCEICGKDFYSKISLQRHIRTHTGEKPFACPLCEKRFTQSNSMKLHYKTFHLKQPYPKRNRNKKYQPQSTEPEETFAEESDSVSQVEPPAQAPPEARPAPAADKHIHDENMELEDDNIHYLTLS